MADPLHELIHLIIKITLEMGDMIPFLQLNKLSHRKIKELTQGQVRDRAQTRTQEI